jgi:hypothetical protein
MIGGDVVIAHVNPANGVAKATDYNMNAKGACANGNGVCPDSIVSTNNSDNATLLSGSVSDGVTTVVYTRPYSVCR